MIVLAGILGLAALTFAWALRSAVKDIELAQYEAQEWEQKAHAAARVADRLAQQTTMRYELFNGSDEPVAIVDGVLCFAPGTVLH